jgi:hypothetical protein
MTSDPEPVKHNFSLPKLAYDQPANKQNYIRISMFFNKRTDVSYEYFQNHWHHVHADLVTASKSYNARNIMRYNQFYQTPEIKAAGQKIGYPMMDWDACTEFWVESLDDFLEFTKSEEYARHTRKL